MLSQNLMLFIKISLWLTLKFKPWVHSLSGRGQFFVCHPVYIYDFEVSVQYVSSYNLLNLLWFKYDICIWNMYILKNLTSRLIQHYFIVFMKFITCLYSIDITINCSLVPGKTLLPRLKRNAHFDRINSSNCLFSVFSLPHVGYLSIWPTSLIIG